MVFILPDTVGDVFLAAFPAGPLAANCYLVASDSHADCVIVDPGMDAADQIDALLTEHDLTPAAVLLTHGHFDHAASAALVADRYRVGCWVGAGDEGQLSDPLSGLPSEMHALFAELVGADAPAARALPAQRLELGAGPVRLAGMDFELLPAPGHTPGSTLISLSYHGEPAPGTVVFTGDVVFAGSVGRTDLPGGDPVVMERTLAEVVLTLPADAILLPGHGPQTSLARERNQNPFLPRSA